MQELMLPKDMSIETTGTHKARIVIHPLHPGYGTTIGNALRRVLLSSLPGSAVTAIKIKGVQHEFSTLPHVSEDVLDIILNLKTLRLISQSAESVKLTLEVKGEREVTAADISKNADVTIVNPQHHIATLSEKAAELKMDLWIEQGLGYAPVENREKKKYELGVIEIDALYSPVRTVNFEIENIRVGQLTNYNKLTLDLETDGSITPEDAFKRAAKILVDHYSILFNQDFEGKEDQAVEKESETPSTADASGQTDDITQGQVLPKTDEKGAVSEDATDATEPEAPQGGKKKKKS